MPANISDVDAFTAPVQVPANGDDGDAGPGGYLRNALQALANRTRYLYNYVKVNGIPKVRVETFVSIKTITGAANGDVALVVAATFPRLFMFVAGTTLGADVPSLAYNANDSSGYWASELYTLLKNAQTFLAGLTINGGDLAVSQDAAIQGDLSVDGTTTCAALSIPTTGSLACAGSAAFVDASLTGDLSVSGICQVGGAALVGSLVVNGTSTLKDTTSAQAPIVLTSQGRIRRRVRVQAVDANLIPAVLSEDIWYVPTGLLTAGRTLTLSDASAADGDVIEIVTEDSTHLVTVNDPLNVLIVALKSAGGFTTSARIGRVAGAWKLLSTRNL